MPIHDWSRVPDGIFHHFHLGWIDELATSLNAGILPDDYYALAEQFAAGFGPDVLTLQEVANGTATPSSSSSSRGANVVLAPPKIQLTGETDMAFYRRKQKTIAVRHVSGDHVIAMVEVVSPGNKASKSDERSLINKATQLLDKRIHLLILDLIKPSRRDPHGVHDAIWQTIANERFLPPGDKPLTLVSYEAGLQIKAYAQPVAVGDRLPDMTLFLDPGAHVLAPLESTYQNAYAKVPLRWRKVLDAPA